MSRIEDYALIGDTHHAALVSLQGSIDWLCLPRFDSGSVFAALLDADRGGYWKIAPAEEVRSVRRSYRGNTLILETTFETDQGSIVVCDCLALERESDPEEPRTVRPEEVLVRTVTGAAGSVRVVMEFIPRFDYGSIVPWFRHRHGGIEAVGGPDALDLLSDVELRMDDRRVGAEFELAEGESASFVMSYHSSHIDLEPARPERCGDLVRRTEEFWERWASLCSYDGAYRDIVIRSLLTLKALTYSPSGGLVAAATTSLPEKIGGRRNWDYRYCWLRDATFTLDVFISQGFLHEAEEWRDWLLRAVAGDPDDMQIMYGVLGERRLNEVELPSLSGFEKSAPVRIGNAAHGQFQLDVYGEVMDSFHSARRAGISGSEPGWDLQQAIADFVSEHWIDADEGIWEVRSGRRHFVHSKVMAWVALDRAVTAVEQSGRTGPVDRWRQNRDRIYEEVMERGVNRRRGCFKRAYDDEELDASLLMLPLVGFIEPKDDLMVGTIRAVEQDLMQDGLLLRYRTHAASDGLPPGEGAFLMCSLWLVDCLVLIGETDKARTIFERVLSLANDVGLLSEQYDPADGRLLGNFPQAFSHVAVVAAAMTLESAGLSDAIRRGQ